MMQRENGVYWRVPEDQWREELVLYEDVKANVAPFVNFR